MSTRGGLSPGYAHQLGVPLRGVTVWGCNLRGVILRTPTDVNAMKAKRLRQSIKQEGVVNAMSQSTIHNQNKCHNTHTWAAGQQKMAGVNSTSEQTICMTNRCILVAQKLLIYKRRKERWVVLNCWHMFFPVLKTKYICLQSWALNNDLSGRINAIDFSRLCTRMRPVISLLNEYVVLWTTVLSQNTEN